ncbi:helix-turn-helix transcriptional regulator [Pseudophaeobacter sp.]|uniref:helix-turn-helix domain-containing protein n=1 Tax=Pseudophaeobacter sp. TaxID=1971739 RepID=UPI003265A43C
MAHPVDIHVGKCIRQRRWLIGKTQQQLAEAVGIKFQQIQKYETGANRVSASRLWDIAKAMDVPVKFFFDGLVPEAADRVNPMETKEAIDLVRLYKAIPEVQRGQLFELARVMSKAA